MCTTRRYLFLCSHPATHRFRNELCQSPSVRGCQIRDYNVFLRYPCQKCRNCGMAPVLSGLGNDQEPQYDDIWQIPSRCFVDVGFRKLHPFGEEASELASSTSSPRQSIDEDPLAPPLSPTKCKSDANICKKLLRRLTMRKPSPCCATEAHRGAFQATRIEGRDYRVDGFIPARCNSPI